MTDCSTPDKKRFRSKAAARRWHRRARILHKARLHPYWCGAGHWHLAHNEPGWKTITPDVDAELLAITERAVARYTPTLLTAQGWTRDELADAVHARLRNKFIQMRDSGQLVRDANGQIRLTTEQEL